ncbi:MAG: adenosine nucleotide hydrolase [Sediminibacterium sp.]|nr:adenosine nucleotide hydrolase [Sediminibacterium sp.]
MDQGSFVCSWSGGKDSCFAVMKALELGYSPKVLLNVLNEEGKISRSHGIPAEILKAQALAAGLPVHLVSSSWEAYEKNFVGSLTQLKAQYGLSHAVFGDIDLQAHRDWEEKVCTAAGLTALLPLWQQDRRSLVMQMLDAGIETLIVSCNTVMGEKFLGKQLSISLVEELEALGVDACGENGEFHTLVTNCPLFGYPVPVKINRTLQHENYWFSEMSLAK